MRVEPFGDEALRFPLPDVDRHTLEAALRRIDGVTDVVFGEHVGLVVGTARAADVAEVLGRPIGPGALSAAPEIVLPTCYDGPDLGRVAEWAGLSIDAVVARHAAPTYTVKFLGFLPGFAYMGDVDPAIAAPRLPSPRPRVLAGAVAVAGARTGVYPYASPGGWNLLGRVGIDLFDLDHGARLHAGDRVRFAPTDRVTRRAHPRDAPSPSPLHVDVLDVVGPAWIQDGGRPGRRGDGVPPGGPLVPELLCAANHAVGNDAFAPALELFGSVTIAARGGDLWVGWAGEPVRLVRDHVRRFDARGLGYLAVSGGFDTPLFLGGRGALPVLGVPTLLGSIGLLRGAEPERYTTPLSLGAPDAPIRVSPGPEPTGLDALLATEWRVGPYDRTGMRLVGPALPSIPEGRLPSAPMIRGAIQLPPGGAPVVLGPDHPTTGGYPVVAVVRHADQGALAARPLGAPVRFVV